MRKRSKEKGDEDPGKEDDEHEKDADCRGIRRIADHEEEASPKRRPKRCDDTENDGGDCESRIFFDRVKGV